MRAKLLEYQTMPVANACPVNPFERRDLPPRKAAAVAHDQDVKLLGREGRKIEVGEVGGEVGEHVGGILHVRTPPHASPSVAVDHALHLCL